MSDSKTTRAELHNWLEAMQGPVEIDAIIKVFTDLSQHELACHINSLQIDGLEGVACAPNLTLYVFAKQPRN